MSTEPHPTAVASARDYERISINIPRGALLTRLKREADATGASVSATAVRALARGLRDGDAEDRLLKLERKLADHMRAASRDAMVQQELIVMIARTLLLHNGLEDEISETRTHRVEAVIDRMLATVLANTSAHRRPQPSASERMPSRPIRANAHRRSGARRGRRPLAPFRRSFSVRLKMFVKIDPNALLTPQDTADMLGVSTATLARWRQDGGELQFVRLSRKTVKYRYMDVAAFIEARLHA